MWKVGACCKHKQMLTMLNNLLDSTLVLAYYMYVYYVMCIIVLTIHNSNRLIVIPYYSEYSHREGKQAAFHQQQEWSVLLEV